MEGRRDESRRIAAARQIVAESAVHEVGHSLCRGSLFSVALLPAVAFYLFLIVHDTQGIITFNVLWPHLNHHARVRPLTTAIAGTHAVDDNLFLVGSSRNNKAARTHAETIHATPVNLGNKAVFCCRKVFSTSLLRVILYLVYQHGRMFQTHANGYAFGLDFHLGICQITVHVASGMSRSQDNWSRKFLLRTFKSFLHNNTLYNISLNNQPHHLCLEANLTTATNNGVAHVLNDPWQSVGTYVRMSIGKDVCRCSVLTENVKNLIYRPTLFGTRIEFAVRVGSRPTLTEAIVAFRVNSLVLANECQILLSFVDVFASFHDNRTQSQLNESQGSKQSARTGSHDNDLWALADIVIRCSYVFIILWLFVDIDTNLQINKNSTFTGIDATFEDADAGDGALVKALFCSKIAAKCLFIGCNMRLYS